MGEQVPAAVREEVFTQSGGNPFYLQELARVSQRPARPFDGNVVFGVPSSVSAALGQEIESLDDGRATPGVGGGRRRRSGRPRPRRRRRRASGEEEMLSALEELVERDVLRATSVPRRYAFRHPIVRRAVYEAAGEAWRLQGARPRGRRAGDAAKRDRGASAPRRALRARGRRGGDGDPGAGGAAGGARGRPRSLRGGCRRPSACCRRGRRRGGQLGLLVPLATALAAGRTPGGGARHAAAGHWSRSRRSSRSCGSGSSRPARRARMRSGTTTPRTRGCCTRSRSSPTTAPPAAPPCRSSSPPTRSTTTTSPRCAAGASKRRETAAALGDPGLLAVRARRSSASPSTPSAAPAQAEAAGGASAAGSTGSPTSCSR